MTQKHPGPATTQTRVCAITMVQNESVMLRRWLDYYGRELGHDNLVVLDDNSTDGSTDDLPCSVLRLPPAPWRQPWAQARRAMANSTARAMLQAYDAVIFVDADEFLVPDPERFDGLVDYLDRHHDRDVVAAVGLNVVHDAAHEPAIDHHRPVLAQRSLVKFVPRMCKPAVKREPASWMAGTHGIQAPFSVDPDLLLFHLKYYDEDELRRVAGLRRDVNEREGRGARSAWTREAEDLVDDLRRWVGRDETRTALDTRRLKLPVPRDAEADGYFRVVGNQLKAMERGRLLRLPDRFRAVEF